MKVCTVGTADEAYLCGCSQRRRPNDLQGHLRLARPDKTADDSVLSPITLRHLGQPAKLARKPSLALDVLLDAKCRSCLDPCWADATMSSIETKSR